MKKLTVFNHVSIDGFFAGPKGEIDWFTVIKKDAKYDAYVNESSKAGATLVLGHTTYEMFKSYWPTPDAIKADPGMAKVMNNSPKIVFSKKMKSVEEEPNWKNITLFHEIDKKEIMNLKGKSKSMTILGSGTIVQQFANLGLIDEYTLLVVPIVLGEGKSLFAEVKEMNLELVEARSFKNGIISLKYKAGK
jgi:dihydrofolate reductase